MTDMEQRRISPMASFHDFLAERIEASESATDDVLLSFLPLMREVIDAHAAGMVAPLEGIDQLQVTESQIWFEEVKRQPPRFDLNRLQSIQLQRSRAFDVVSESQRADIEDADARKLVDLRIGKRDEGITKPVFLPGYVSWEHLLDIHDPLTDVFSLGLILASLTCGLDLTDPQSLEALVTHRTNLFQLNPQIHPVLARAVVRMTELDRHRRVQDLTAVLRTLENYREQDIDFEMELARIPGLADKDPKTKQAIVMGKLRERLFEISRRNRLLHFRSTMQTLNLTQASVPLRCRIEEVPPERILVFNQSLHQQVTSGKQLSLNKYLNFSEAVYLPGVLDRIVTEARRDQTEFGFAQLRLVICFLHWANLKTQPIERFESPLILLPVRLHKKKGIRDTYYLDILDNEAEINPVVRHQFKEIYGIQLPESIDLATTTVDQFYDYLNSQIQSSSAEVSLNKIDRPRIELIRERARRKLDLFRSRARVSGRGVRSFLEIDYSYDPMNYHPLGIKLFDRMIRTPATRLRAVVQEHPEKQSFAAAPPENSPTEREKTFYSLREGGEENPYIWNFDLCSVTLANFKYRRMSPVRDYDALLEQQPPNPAFDATFSLVPRAHQSNLPVAPSLRDRYDIVPCDPTQATSIAEARLGNCYIIQGPPGTGKSQTITNLIADFVARGLRVLFVCEKRAAIDVVYTRLRQCGLGDLCTLIHDSQSDKREFVMNLKNTYERFLSESQADDEAQDHPPETEADGEPDNSHLDSSRQSSHLQRMIQELQTLEHVDALMRRADQKTAIPVRQLIERCIELSDQLPDLSPLATERLPDYGDWWRHREAIHKYANSLAEIQPDQIIQRHPLGRLSARLATEDRPLERIDNATATAKQHLQQIHDTLDSTRLGERAGGTLAQLRSFVDYARSVLPVSKTAPYLILDAESAPGRKLTECANQIQSQRAVLDRARQHTEAWTNKLPASEARAALQQSRAVQDSFMRWLNPGWWRLRGVVNRAYDFQSHAVRPTMTQVLASLVDEYEEQEKLDDLRRQTAREFNITQDVDQFLTTATHLRNDLPHLEPAIAEIHSRLLADDNAADVISRIAALQPHLDSMVEALSTILDDPDAIPLPALHEELDGIERALEQLPDFLYCLSQLADVPERVVKALRTLPLNPTAIEAATADRSLQFIYQKDRAFHRFTGSARHRHAERLESQYQQWLADNAVDVRHRVRNRFIEHVRRSSLPAAQLTTDEKEFKKRYNRGRRELEHEFGKSMRYKSIRDLVADESGEVIKDLMPVWLMSPLSVSDTLPLDTDHMDVVIFDEASQITLEEAIPSLFRATQAIVVGDEMQLPPTDFFSAKRPDEQEELWIEQDGELVQYDLESNSFLNHASKNLPSTMLGWHYRSRSESLISFSNWAFYEGRLLTVPEEQLPSSSAEPLRIQNATDAEQNVKPTLQRAISFHFMESGIYHKRRNRMEADYIASLVRGLLAEEAGWSIGVVAFSEAQQDEIEASLERLANEDAQFRERLDAELEREDDGQFVGLLVKNLENIQGDERDVVILSICYGFGPTGKMLMNFGPINRSGGEKRLNVAFSRAKHHMVLVSSIKSSHITNEYNDGANCLKNYLRYAEATSEGQTTAAENVLRSLAPWHDVGTRAGPAADNVLATRIYEALVKRGYVVARNVGQSQFQCDLAVRLPTENTYKLGILIDSKSYYEQRDLLEREMMRPKLLRDFGWNVMHVLSKDWYHDRESVLARIIEKVGPI